MELKRIYRFPEGWKPERNVADPSRATARNPLGLRDPSRQLNDVLNPPPVDHFLVKHTGVNPEQNFSEKLIRAGQTEGFLTMSGGRLILHSKPENLQYKILRGPGYYCCHCGKELPDANLFIKDDQGEPTDRTFGMEHVEQVHSGKKSPDSNNPAGYRRVNGYECVLEEGQHKKFNFHEFQKKRLAGPKRTERSKDNG